MSPAAGGDGGARPSVLFVRNARGHTEISGPETYMLTIIPQLQARGLDVALHCIVNPALGHPVFLDDFERLGVPITVSSVGGAAYASDVGAVMRDAAGRGATVLHSFDHRSDIVSLLAGRRGGQATVASFAGWTNWTGESLKERVYMAADRFALNRADAVLIDSRFVGTRARLKPGPRPVVVLPNGVDPGRFSGLDGAAGKMTHFGTPDCIVFSIVGRIHPNKRQLDFVRAAADLVKADPRARFLIIGAAPDGHEAYAAEVTAQIAALGLEDKVHQHLAQPAEIPALLAATDVLLAPCTTESCSFAIIEAMASAIPVVAARAGGNPELVDDPATGFLTAAQDWVALRDAAHRLLMDAALRDRMGQAGRARITARYTVDRMGAETVAIYDAVRRFHRAPRALSTHLRSADCMLLS